MASTSHAHDLSLLNIEYDSDIWDQYTPSEILLLPSNSTVERMKLMLAAVETGLSTFTTISAEITTKAARAIDILDFASKYLAVLEKQGEENKAVLPELGKKRKALQAMIAKFSRFPEHFKLSNEVVENFEQVKRLGNTILAQQEMNEDDRVKLVNRLAVGMKCIDSVWAKIQVQRKELRLALMQDRVEKVEFVVNFEATFKDGTKAQLQTDVGADEGDVRVSGDGRDHIKHGGEDDAVESA